jgi:hypothetical protein
MPKKFKEQRVDIGTLAMSVLEARNSTMNRRDAIDLVVEMADSLTIRGVTFTDAGEQFAPSGLFYSHHEVRRMAEERGWFADESDGFND